MTSERLPISAYIVCKNEVSRIGRCIESLDMCSEIVVVDSGSTDGTLEVVRSHESRGLPIRLIHNDWPGYAKQKQFALEQCREEWALCLDADERLDAQLRAALPDLISAPAPVAGWRIPRRLFLHGYGYVPEAVHDRGIVRLSRRSRSRYDLNLMVHEALVLDGEERSVPRGKILHYAPLKMEDQILKENQYSSLKARQMFNAGRKPRLWRLVLNPAAYFFKIYFVRRNFLCGWAGFVHAKTGALYAFMTEAKLWQMHRAASRPDSEPAA